MPSPFPGMDPWLEAKGVFPNLHTGLIVRLQDALNASLPVGFVATITTRVWVDDESTRDPDVSVIARRRKPRRPSGGAAAVAVEGLAGLTHLGRSRPSDRWEEPYLDIRTDDGKRLVTGIEVVSPSNKRKGPGRRAYLVKQQEYRLGEVHLVEIDLLRAGTHVTRAPRTRLTAVRGAFDYHVSVERAGDTSEVLAAPLRLDDRLPAFGVPLTSDVPPVVLDLQAAFDRTYDGGRYPLVVNYRRPPAPPLPPEQSAWANDRLRAAGLLPATPPGG